MPKVSIVIPVYNSEKYLGWCLNSVVNQTYRDVEIILVNDGSTDKSLSICKNYAMIDSRIKIVDIKNGGVSNARNIGIENATGKYIQFVDSDDYVKPEMTETLVSALECYNADIAFCGMKVYDVEHTKAEFNMDLTIKSMGEECVLNGEAFFKKLPWLFLITATMEGPCNRIYLLDIIKKHNIRFPLDMCYGEDCVFNLEYYDYIESAALLAKPMYYYFWRKLGSLSHTHIDNLFENQMRQVKMMEDLLKRKNCYNKDSQRVVAEYCLAQAYKCLFKIVNESDDLELDQKKAEIARILNDKFILKCASKAVYCGCNIPEFRNFLINCDVIKVISEVRIQEVVPAVILPPVIAPNPGIVNRVFAKFARILHRISPNGRLGRWAKTIENSLLTVGLKTTIKKIFNKIGKKARG